MLFIIAVMMVGAFFVSCRQRFFRPARIQYEGQIVDKWMGFTDSETGSFPYYRILIEEKSGKRITMPIDYETYERVKVRMWIRSSKSGIELSAQPAQSP